MKTLIVTTILCAFSFGAMAADAPSKMGYVDLQKAIQETSTGKKAKKDLETEFNKKKKELEKTEADLKKKSEDYEKKSMVLSDELKMQKQGELQQDMLKYRDLVGKSQMEIQKRERELTMPIVEKLHAIISDIAKKEGYVFVLEKNEQSVLYADKSTDLTDRVLKEYEKTAKK